MGHCLNAPLPRSPQVFAAEGTGRRCIEGRVCLDRHTDGDLKRCLDVDALGLAEAAYLPLEASDESAW